MTLYTKLNKDLSAIIDAVDTYITDTNVHSSALAAPFIPLVPLSKADVFANVPGLETVLSDENLTFDSMNLYCIYSDEVVYSHSHAYLIMPVKNCENIQLVISEPKPDAVAQTSHVPNITFYLPDDCDELEVIPLANDGIYLVDANVHHSFRYEEVPYITEDTIGICIVAATNEDLSGLLA